jgi:hypothetical protein
MMGSWTESLVKGALAGTIGGIGSVVLYGESSNYQVPMFGMQMSAPVAVGTAVGVGSIGADLVHNTILPYTPGFQKYQSLETAVVGVGAAAGLSALALKSAGMSSADLKHAAMLGGGSYIVADYTTSKLWGGYSGMTTSTLGF